MPTYRVRPGVTFGPGGHIQPGELVALTEYEAGGFLDKLELVQEPATHAEEQEDPAEPVETAPPAEELEVPEAPVEPAPPIVIDASDGIDAAEASQASKALNQRKKGK